MFAFTFELSLLHPSAVLDLKMVTLQIVAYYLTTVLNTPLVYLLFLQLASNSLAYKLLSTFH